MKAKKIRKKEVTLPTPHPWWHHLLVVLMLLVAAAGLYSRSLDLGYFSLDDPDYVMNNGRIDSLSKTNLGLMLSEPYFANYSPAHLLSYAVDVAVAGGKSAKAFHVSNVIWYGWVAAMVYLLAVTIGVPWLASALGALLFVVHPAHVEVVGWISSRKDLIATGFGALSMTSYLWHRRGTKGRWGWYAASLGCFLLASAAKQSVVLLPGVFLVWDFLVEKRRQWSMALDKVPFALVSLFFAWKTVVAQPETTKHLDPFTLATTQFQNLWLLTGLGDYVLYRPNVVPEAWNPFAILLIMLSAVVLWFLPLLFLKQLRPVQVGLIYWTLIQLTPPMAMKFLTPVTDRYLFLASVGFCILAADWLIGLADKAPSWKRTAILALGPCLAAVWAIKTFQYVEEWRDPRSVWYAAKTKAATENVFEYLGGVYQDAGLRMNDFISSGKPLKVADELKLASLILNDPAQVEKLRAEWQTNSPAAGKSATQAYRDKLWELAWGEFESAVAHRGTVNTPNLFFHRGKLRVDQGRPAEGIPELKKALELAKTHTYLRIRQDNATQTARAIGVAYWAMRDFPHAREWLLEAKRIQQASGQVWIATLDAEIERATALIGNQ